MASEEADSLVVYKGAQRTIEYAVRSNGSVPAREFIESLDQSEQARMLALFTRLGDSGKITHKEQFKKLEGNIWEFKRHQVRVLCFQEGGRWILTHGFPRRQMRQSEIERAEKIREEHLKR